MKYVQALRFTERPDYNYLKGILWDLLNVYYIPPFSFDFNIAKNPQPIKNVNHFIYFKIRSNPEEIIKSKTSEILNKNKMAYIFTDSLTKGEIADSMNLNQINHNHDDDIDEKEIENDDDLTNSKNITDNRENLTHLTEKTEENSFYNEGELLDIINNFYKPEK